MIVVASSGLNLPRELVTHCRIEETPHQIAVDGTLHEVRSVSIAQIKEWLQTAKTTPHALGSSAAEYVNQLTGLLKRTNEVLIVTGTRKLLGSYDAAVAAARVLGNKGLEVRVVDTSLVELGAGLIAAYCGANARAGRDMSTIIEAAQTLSEASMQLCIPRARDFLVKMGRYDPSSSARPSADSWLMIGMQDGEVRNLGSYTEHELAATKLFELLKARYPRGSALWITLTFSDDPAPGRELLALLRRQFDVRYCIVRPLTAMGYLFLGSNALLISVHPVDAMKHLVRLPEAR